MKKVFLSSVFSVLFLFAAIGQLKHVKGISNVGITYGITGTGNVFGAGYSRYIQPVWIWNVNASYEGGKVESTKLKQYIMSSGVDYTCFKAREFLYLNAGLSLFAGFERLTSEEITRETKSYIFGPSGNLNIELYLNPRLIFQMKAEQYYSPLSKLGNWFPVYSISLKYCIF
jgi:hypothetical protein